MTFGEAIEKMKNGAFVAREGWNGKNMFVYMTKGSNVSISALRDRALKAVLYGTNSAEVKDEVSEQTVKINPHIDMFAADGSIVCGWLASQTDMLSDDWYVRDYAQNI